METMNELSLGLSFGYVPDWKNWQVIRELTSNGQDTGTKVSIRKDANNNLIIHDDGDGLLIKHLLIGESGSRDDGDKIGQFGEGLKMAILVLTRNEKIVKIESQNKIIVNSVKEIEGVKTLSFVWETVTEFHHGTTITIFNWDDGDYRDRFLFLRDDLDDLTIFNAGNDGAILTDRKLYNQGVYVKEIDNFAFGYAIHNKTQNNRDRNIISDWDLYSAVGRLWAKVNIKEGWAAFFEAVQDGAFEKDINLSGCTFDADMQTAVKDGFMEVFGKNIAIQTNRVAAREAEHCGADVVILENFGYYLRDLLSKLFPTDEQFVKEKKGKKAFRVPMSSLDETQRKNLSFAKRMARRVQFDGEVIPAEIPEFAGLYDETNNCIKIRPIVLIDMDMTKEVMIHELGHWISGGAADLSEQHVAGCCKIGRLLMK